MEARSEEPSPRKLRKARERGEVPASPLATTAIVLAGVSVAFALGGDATLASWRRLATTLLSTTSMAPRDALAMAADVAGRSLVLPLAAAVACGALGGFLQVGPLLAPKALAPDLARLHPARGLARLFAPDALGSRLGALAVCALLFAIGAQVLGASLPGLAGRAGGGAGVALGALAAVLEALLGRALIVLALAGGIAVVYRRWRFHRAQRMTRREVRDERRETEGEPDARRRRAEAHRQLVRRADESLAGAALVVRGVDRAVVVRFRPSADEPPAVALVARGSMLRRVLARASTEGIPVVHDERLAGELERLSAGRTLARAALQRLARHLARSRPRRLP